MFLKSSYWVLSGHENNAIVTECRRPLCVGHQLFVTFLMLFAVLDMLISSHTLQSSGHTEELRGMSLSVLQRPLPLLNKKTVQVMVFGSLNFFCEKCRIKLCSTHNMWIRWSFRSISSSYCPASRTTLVATRFRVAVICPIIQVPHCIRVFFYFVWFVFINHIFQFYYELCTYCNILDIYLS